jgi:Spy/CpxP family protein refolding chaperone
MTRTKWTTIVVAAALVGGLSTAALAGEGKHGRRGGARQEQIQQRRRGMAFLQSLQFTDAQRQVMLDKARAAATIVQGSKAEARKIVAAAWAKAGDASVDKKAIRADVKTQLEALRAKTWPQIEPLAKDVVASLTPEQRQKIDAAAGKRGKTLDDAKLTKLFGRLLSRPMTVPYLEARLGVSTPK